MDLRDDRRPAPRRRLRRRVVLPRRARQGQPPDAARRAAGRARGRASGHHHLKARDGRHPARVVPAGGRGSRRRPTTGSCVPPSPRSPRAGRGCAATRSSSSASSNPRPRPDVEPARPRALAIVLAPAVPLFSPWSLIPLLVAVCGFGLVDARFSRFRRPEVAIVVALAVAQAMIATAIVINDRQHLGDLALLIGRSWAWPRPTPGRVVAAWTAYSGALSDRPRSSASTLGRGLHQPVGALRAARDAPGRLDAHRRAARERGRAAGCRDRRRLTGMLNRTASHRSAGARAPDRGGHRAPRGPHRRRRRPLQGGQRRPRSRRRRHRPQGHRLPVRKHQRDDDLAYRLGGEEFVVALPAATTAPPRSPSGCASPSAEGADGRRPRHDVLRGRGDGPREPFAFAESSPARTRRSRGERADATACDGRRQRSALPAADLPGRLRYDALTSPT